MKKHFLKILITALLAIAAFVVFSQDSTFLSGRNKVAQDTPALKYAYLDSAADFQNFKASAESNITNNKKIIDQLRVFKMKGDNESKAKYRNQVSELEEKNDEMSMRIAIADMVTTANWPAFKRSFTKEMIELTTSLRNLSDNYQIN